MVLLGEHPHVSGPGGKDEDLSGSFPSRHIRPCKNPPEGMEDKEGGCEGKDGMFQRRNGDEGGDISPQQDQWAKRVSLLE